MVTSEVKVGDEFIYVTPVGKQFRYRVVELEAPTCTSTTSCLRRTGGDPWRNR